MTLKVNITAGISGSVQAVAGLAQLEAALALKPTLRFLTGAGADRADVVFSDRRTLASSATEDLDLLTGLTDIFGAAMTMERLKAILVVADDDNTNDVLIGGGTSALVGPLSATSHKVRVRPGGFALFAARDAVAWDAQAGSSNLRFANDGSGSTVTFSVLLLGVSDDAAQAGVLDFSDPTNSALLAVL